MASTSSESLTTAEAVSGDHVIEQRTLLAALMELTKARLSALVLVTTAAGFVLALTGPMNWLLLLWTIVGTGLAAGCANALNQAAEVEFDRRMPRTQGRPLVVGDVTRSQAVTLALVMGVVGVGLLAMLVNIVAAGLAFATILLYVLVYTPMKRRTTLNTLVGAVCGALPPMIGWAAVTGGLEAGAWWLGAMLFVWQMPHFFALAWLYREDYRRGGFVMLPAVDPSGRITCQAIVLLSLALLPLAMCGTLMGLAGWTFAIGSVILGGAMLGLAVRMMHRPSNVRARHVFFASIIYLPILLALLVADRGPVNQETLRLTSLTSSSQVADGIGSSRRETVSP